MEINRIYSLIRSFKYAINGVAFCIKYERNMRIHIVFTAYVIYFSRFFKFTRAEFIVILLLCFGVMAFECINTAIEVVVDKVSPRYHTLAKIAKDTAAAAVFLFSFAALIIGLILFLQIDTLMYIWVYFSTNVLPAVILIVSAILSGIFIFGGKTRMKSRKYVLDKENMITELKSKDNEKND